MSELLCFKLFKKCPLLSLLFKLKQNKHHKNESNCDRITNSNFKFTQLKLIPCCSNVFKLLVFFFHFFFLELKCSVSFKKFEWFNSDRTQVISLLTYLKKLRFNLTFRLGFCPPLYKHTSNKIFFSLHIPARSLRREHLSIRQSSKLLLKYFPNVLKLT